MRRVVAVLRHRDVDVELAIDVVQLGCPDVRVRRRRLVDNRACRGPLREVGGARDLDVAARSVEEVIVVAVLKNPRIRAGSGLDCCRGGL